MYVLCAFGSGKVCILRDYHINGIDYALWFIKNSMVQVMVLIVLFFILDYNQSLWTEIIWKINQS